MYNNSDILRFIEDPQAEIDPKWVLDMLDRHPTFIAPALLLLKRNPESLDEETRRKLQARIVLNCADRAALADVIDPADGDWANIYPPEIKYQATTEQTISDFINTYGQPSTPEEDSVLERLLFNPVPADYFSGTDEPYNPDDPLALPPELMPQHDEEDDVSEPQHQSNDAEAPDENGGEAQTGLSGDESLLMESLAKIFIKQHRYERAYEIISKLSLKYPEKSVYFADQLRFLQKLIINQRYQTKN